MFPRDNMAKNYCALKLSNCCLFPKAYSTIVGMFTIVNTKKSKANALSVISNKDAPNPISF